MMIDIRAKIGTYGDKVYTNFQGLNVPEADVECKYATIVSTSSLLVYKYKYYLQVYLGNCAYKIMDKQMIDYVDNHIFHSCQFFNFDKMVF